MNGAPAAGAVAGRVGNLYDPCPAWKRVRGRLPVVLLLLAAVAAAGQSADLEYLPEPRAECYDCHAGDAVPLRSLYVVAARPVDTAQTPFTVTVQVGNAWLHEQRYLGPRLDLTNAPSLRFTDDREPVEATATGAIDTTPRAPEPPSGSQILPDTDPTFGPYGGHVVLEVPAGATTVVLRMEETGSLTDPDVTWNLYSGRSVPDGLPDRTVRSRGEAAELRLDGPDDFAGLAYGNWTVEAQVVLGNGTEPAVGEVPFHVSLRADFDNAANRVSRLGRQLGLGPGQSTLFSWTLERVGQPGPGESVRLDVDGSAYYEHQTAQGPEDDWAHVTKGLDIPVTPSTTTPGGVRIAADVGPVGPLPEPPGLSLVAVLEAVGYAGAFLVVGSMVSGGVFGRRSRRGLNALFGTARRRVAFHNALSYGLLLAALAHSVLFVLDSLGGGRFHWSLGLLWGGAALLAMSGLGVTGAFQVALIRRWSHATWRRVHLGLALATLGLTLLHLLLDGAHFGAVQDWIGYRNPLDPRLS